MGAQRAREVAAYRYAFENRDRLTERERRLAAASYYNQVTFEIDKAIVEYEALLERDPDDETALNNLGVALGRIGREERAEALYLRKIELSPDEFAPGYWNAYQTRLNLGNFDGAREILDSARVRFGNDYAWQYAMASAVEGDLQKAEADLLAIWSEIEPGSGGATFIGEDLAAIAAARGRLIEAAAYVDASISANKDLGRPAEVLEDVVQAAWIELAVRDATGPAMERLDGALDLYPLSDLEPLDRPYLALVQIYARAGDLDRARSLLAELETEVPEELRKGLTPELLRAEGEIAVAQGRYDDATRDFRRSFRGECKLCGMAGLAHAYDRAGERDSALALWERFATTPFADRYAPYVVYTYALGPGVGPAYERVAQLADETGDLEKAAEYYARFVELWANADEELQPRVQAAQARLEEIVRERG
jgi:tetratricopeptide (TPR) repeat protein